MEAERVKIELGPSQGRLFASRAKFPGGFGGSGSGKSYVLYLKAVTNAFKHPGIDMLITEPINDLIFDVGLPSLERILGLEGDLWEMNRQRRQVTFENGSTLALRTAGIAQKDLPSRRLGPTYGWVGMDEVFIGNQQQTFFNLVSRLRQEGMPNQLMVVGTPKGRKWAYWRWDRKVAGQGERARSVENPGDYEVFHIPTEENAPNLPEGYIETLKQTYSGDYLRQELYGEAVGYGSLIYPEFQVDVHVRPLPAGIIFKKVIGGVDPAGAGITSMHLTGIDLAGRYHVFRELYKRALDETEMVQTMWGWQGEHHVRAFAVPQEASLLERHLTNLGIRVMRVKNQRAPGIQRVRRLLRVGADGMPALTVTPECPWLISEFQMYERSVSADGVVEDDEPADGQADHALDDLRYQLSMLESAPPVQAVELAWAVG